MKIINTTYAIVLFVLISINLAFHFNDSLKHSIISDVFSFNKSTEAINAKVIGYSFKANRGQRGRSATFNYDYGILYFQNNKKYFGRYTIAKNENWKYRSYVPLPKRIQIVVNKSKPEQFIYLNTHYGKGFGFYLFNILTFIGAVSLFCLRKEITKEEIIKKFKTTYSKRKITAIIGIIWFPIIFFSPIINAVYSFVSFNKGAIAENITGFEIVNKNPEKISEIKKLKDKKLSSTDFIYLNADIYNLDNLSSIVDITGFEDKSIKKCYIISKKNRKVELEFKYENNRLKIYQERDLAQRNFNIYAISNKKKYLIPIDMLQFDFEYK